MTGDFNIRDNTWNSLFSHYLIYSNTLRDIADSFNICLFKSTNQVPTRYVNNPNNLNLVIDLIFLHPNSEEFDNHTIYSDWRMSSDHAPIMVNIFIFEEHIQTKKQSIKNSEEERNFITEIIESIKQMNTDHIKRNEDLEQIVQDFTYKMNDIWFKHSKIVNITRYLKLW